MTSFINLYTKMLIDILEKNQENKGLNVACLITKSKAVKSFGYNNWVSGRSFDQPLNRKVIMKEEFKDVEQEFKAVFFRGDVRMGSQTGGFSVLLRLKPKAQEFEIYDSREKMKNHAEMNAILHMNTIGKHNEMFVNMIPCPNCAKFLMSKRMVFPGVFYYVDNGKYPETWGMAVISGTYLLQVNNIEKISEEQLKKLKHLTFEGNSEKPTVKQELMSSELRVSIDKTLKAKETQTVIDRNTASLKVLLSNSVSTNDVKIHPNEIVIANDLEQFNKYTANREYDKLLVSYPEFISEHFNKRFGSKVIDT